ncbi:MAG TPA: tetratricopeptide repeat protein [Chthoniobacterales bacterium]
MKNPGSRILLIAWVTGIALQAFAQEATPSPTPRFPPLSVEAKTAAQQGMTAFQSGDLDSARLAFEKMRGLSPGHPMALINLGTILFQQGKLDQAAEMLQQATVIAPDSAEAWTFLGMVFVRQEKFDEALAALARSQVIDPNNPRTHNYLGVTVGRKGWFDGAEAELRRALELDPKYADAQFNLTLIYLQRDPPDLELAKYHYQKAIALGAPPDDSVAKQLK